MEILYLTDVSQIDYLRKTNPLLLRQMRPLTGDMVVAFELEKMGVHFIDEWDYIKPEELKKNWELAHSLSITWWHGNVANRTYEEFSLCEAAQQDMVYPLTACLNARTVYERLFREFKVDSIDGYFLPNTAVIRTGPAPTSRALGSLTQAVLFYMAEKRRIPINKRESKLPLTQAKLALSNSKINTLRALWSSKSTSPISALNTNETSDKIVLIYEALMPDSEYASLISALKTLPNLKVLTVSMLVLEQSKFIHNLHSDLDKRLKQSLKEVDNLLKNYEGDYPEIFSNNHLSFQFDRVKVEMGSAARYGGVFNAFLEILRPSLIIFAHEAFTVERVLVRMAKNKNIPTVSLSHTGVRHNNGYRGSTGDADVIAVWNETDLSSLAYYGVDKSRLIKIGSLRYEADYIKYASSNQSELYNKRLETKKQLGLSQEKPLVTLLTAAINTGFASALANPRKHRDAIREFIALAKSRPDLQFIIKAHPSFDYYELYRRLSDSKKFSNIKFVENITLRKILEASDLCLMINYCSTASLEAMLQRVPVVYVNNAIYPLDDWRDNLSDVGLPRTKSITEFQKILKTLLRDSEARKKSLENAHVQVAELLDIGDSTATSRIRIAIKDLLEVKQVNAGVSFLHAKTMENFLLEYHANVTGYFHDRSKIDAPESMVLAYSYIAGYNNIGPSSIDAVFQILNESDEYGESRDWDQTRRSLISSYISGRLQNWDAARSRIRDLRLIVPYLMWPPYLTKLNSRERSNIIKYTTNTLKELLTHKVLI
jgi:glycosyltransferase involved in cell wall biosynthesis